MKDVTFEWSEECQKSFNVLKENKVIVPIFVFLDWNKEFHVHVDASCIVFGIVLVQLGEGEINHPIAFASKNISKVGKNYNTTERETLAMVYVLYKFRHYLLGAHLKMITDHSTLKYLVKKPILGGKICRWLSLFQEYDFNVVVKPRRLNIGPNHLSRIETEEEPINIEDNLLDAQLFTIIVADDHFIDIIQFMAIGMAPTDYTMKQKKELVVREFDFSLIFGHLYKTRLDGILRRYILGHERQSILTKVGLWWPTIHKDVK